MADRLPTAGNAAPRNTPPPTAAAARKPSPGPCQPTLSPKFACQRAPAKSFQMPCASVALGPSVGLGRCASASRQVRISICVAPPAIRSVLRPARNYDARSWRMSTPASSGNGAQAKLAGAEQEVEATLEAGEEAKAKLGGSVKPEEQLEALQERDWAAVLTYLGATTTQFLLIRLFLRLLQFATSVGPLSQGVAPTVVVALFFATMSLKSRIFSPLDNSRPTRSSEKDQIKQGKRPSWMPPPVVFPVVWSAIAVLRTISSVMIWEACGRDLLAAPLGWFLLHLCIGDTWNTINNVEARRGTSAAFVLLVLASVYNAAYQYFQVSSSAGLVLAPSCVWLSIATVLIWTIWSINGKEPLFPLKPARA